MTCQACGKRGLVAWEVVRFDAETEPCCWECIKWWSAANDRYADGRYDGDGCDAH